jgi:hypothetical protein
MKGESERPRPGGGQLSAVGKKAAFSAATEKKTGKSTKKAASVLLLAVDWPARAGKSA